MGGSGADLPRPLPRRQEHWTESSKGLLQDFANGTLGRGHRPRPRGYSSSSFHTQEGEDDGDYELIRGGRGSWVELQSGRGGWLGSLSTSVLPPDMMESPDCGESVPLIVNGGPCIEGCPPSLPLPPLPAPGSSSSSPSMQRPSINVDPRSVSHSGYAGPLLVPLATRAHSPVFPRSASNSGSHHLKT